MFEIKQTAFVLVDVQGKLASVMHNRESLFRNLETLLRGMQALHVPVIWMEQIPEKMGPTLPNLAELMKEQTPIAKSSFSCCGSDAFLKELRKTNPRQIVLAGIEAHVCVYQTACDLLDLGFEVEVVADAVSSRTSSTCTTALRRISDAGAGVTSVETILFELMRTAEHPAFRDVLRLVK
ncbi:MAG: isochorismatase family protein [Lentisphaerae bacterium]|nr:isochorismatase family protein [Lentisphaerota bacterium]